MSETPCFNAVFSKPEGRVCPVNAANRPVWTGPGGVDGQFN